MNAQIVCQLAVGEILVNDVMGAFADSQFSQGVTEAYKVVAILKGITVL